MGRMNDHSTPPARRRPDTGDAGHILLDRTTTAYVPDVTGGSDGALGGRTPDDLRGLAVAVAAEAAAHVRQARRRAADSGGRISIRQTKSSDVDPVTDIDQTTEELIRHRLVELTSASGSADAILGEEGGGDSSAGSPGRVTWIVDPVDGTVNLVYGIPATAVSIAACVDGIPVAGAVADIVAQTVYSASSGGELVVTDFSGPAPGTRRDAGSDAGLQVGNLAHALVATGFSYTAERRRAQANLLVDLLPDIRDIRRFGSAALDLCSVATGRVDAYYEHGLGPWDHAAGCLIAARAGAVVHMPPLHAGSGDGIGIVAAAPGIVDELAARVLPVSFPAPGGTP